MNTILPIGLPHLCTDCHTAAYDVEPDMGDDFGFAPGACTNCGNDSGVVWFITD